MKLPSYSHHKATGQAYVRLNGKFVYLGKYGTDESRAKYERVIGAWLANDRQLSEEEDTKPGTTLTVDQLFACYLEHCKNYYRRNGEPTQEYQSHVYLRNKISSIANLPADKLTPSAIDGLRQKWIAIGNSRKFINKSAGRITRMYKWGVEKELVSPQVWQKLTAISGLKAGRTNARDPDPIQPVEDAVVDAAVEHMPNDLAAMLRIQRLTGARPGELWIMHPGDIDRSGDVWTYVPRAHKTQHHGKRRVIWIGPKAQRLLLPYLLRAADELCFRRPSGKPWDRHAYREAVHLACKYAKVEKFNPNQLRHSAGTEVRKRFGLDGAQTLLGHSHADVTQVYAEVDNAKGAMIAREIG
ncbi:MAG: site-specific integrase [Planctomycetes bacterium]|nr:site-specific integrase [Planctomycetota bacterium]